MSLVYISKLFISLLNLADCTRQSRAFVILQTFHKTSDAICWSSLKLQSVKFSPADTPLWVRWWIGRTAGYAEQGNTCSCMWFDIPRTLQFYWIIGIYPQSVICLHITMTSQWARWRLKSPASPLFTQPFIRAQIKENIKDPRHWPLWGDFTGNRWILLTNGQ